MLVMFLVILTGCSWQRADDQAKKGVFSGEKESEYRLVGDKKQEGNNVYLLNSTGAEITGIYLKKNGKKSWGKNQLEKNDQIKKDEKVKLACGKKQSWKYTDIKIKYKKGTQTLTKLQLEKVKSIRIYKTKHYAYTEYLDVAKKQIVSTKKLEKQRFEKAEAKRKAEEAAKKAAEEARKAEEAKQLAAQQEQQQSETTNSTQSRTSSQTRSTTSHKKTTTKRQEENCADSGNEGTYVDDGNGGWKWVPN